jgi:hypothetical protein
MESRLPAIHAVITQAISALSESDREKATARQLPPKAMVTVPRWLMRQRDYGGVRRVIVGD